MGEPNKQVKLAILQGLVARWENTRYETEVMLRVAKRIGDETMQQQSVEMLARCEKALDELAQEAAVLEESEHD